MKDMGILEEKEVIDTLHEGRGKWNLHETMSREEYEKLFHLRGKKIIFRTYDDKEVRVGDWVYVDNPPHKNRIESEPDIIEGFYKSYYEELFIVVRLGSLGKKLGKRRTYSLKNFKELIRAEKIQLLDMPKFSYGDKFKNKYNKEEVMIRDVPRSKNQKQDEFVYFVRTYSTSEGYNYRSMSEAEITEFYYTEGVFKR